MSGFLGIALSQEFHGAFEVGKQHGDVLAFTFQSATGRENLLRKIGWHIGERGLRRCHGWRGCGSGAGGTRPDEAALRLVVHLWMGKEEFVLQGGEVVLIELELELKGPIRQAAPLAQVEGR